MPEQIKAHITGVVFQIPTKTGDRVGAGDPVIVLESMKMEIPVVAPLSGTVSEVAVAPDTSIKEGDLVVVIDEG